MASSTFELLRHDLPNFPEEVLTDWLEPYANSEGWPPPVDGTGSITGRWRYILIRKPLSYWQSLNWGKVTRRISAQDLSSDELQKVVELALAAVLDQTNLYSLSIPNLKNRFFRIVTFLAENGTLPKAPSLIHDQDGLRIMDGNHRIAAYLYCSGAFKLEVDPDIRSKTKAEQNFWVAQPNP